MPLYYFHCTDGRDLVVDRTGRRLRQHHIPAFARCTARALTDALTAGQDWSLWQVNVYDDQGFLKALVPFPEVADITGHGGKSLGIGHLAPTVRMTATALAGEHS